MSRAGRSAGPAANPEPEENAAGTFGFSGAHSMYQKMLAAKKAREAGSSSSPARSPKKPAVIKIKVPPTKMPKNSTILVFGSTNYADIGKKIGSMLGETDDMPNLLTPHRLLAGFGKIKIRSIATSGSSAHVIALGADGETFAWGRNESGQLGVGDFDTRHSPTRVLSLDKVAADGIQMATTGKAHTLFLTKSGNVLAAGACKQGACGPNQGKWKRIEFVVLPISVPFADDPPKITMVSAGQNFNLALDESGDVWSWGYAEFGVLGNGTDHMYNKAEGTVKLAYEPQEKPEKVGALTGVGCIYVACGQYHCAAVAGDGTCYTWGNGGYGRLGHKDQTDLHAPKALEECRAQRVACGAKHTAIIGWPNSPGVTCTGPPSLFMMGQVKSASQNAWMFPKQEEELRGWELHTIGVGNGHNVVQADSSVIAWGSAAGCGELGIEGKKTSANPAKVPALEQVKVAEIACGIATTFLLVEGDATVGKLPEFTPSLTVEKNPKDEPVGGAEEEGSKSKAKGKKRASPDPAVEPPASSPEAEAPAAKKKGKKAK